jgi:hypothetical protein
MTTQNTTRSDNADLRILCTSMEKTLGAYSSQISRLIEQKAQEIFAKHDRLESFTWTIGRDYIETEPDYINLNGINKPRYHVCRNGRIEALPFDERSMIFECEEWDDIAHTISSIVGILPHYIASRVYSCPVHVTLYRDGTYNTEHFEE